MQALLTQTLALRSVKISLDTIYPDGSGTRVSAEVDAAGNYHLKKTFEGGLPAEFPQAMGEPPDSTELYVVQGVAYGPDQSGEIVKAEASGLASQLETLLRGVNGPGLWINVLPDGSLALQQNAEQKGGFQAAKYAVQGDIEGSAITGAIWVDPENQALIAAELNVPGALVSNPDQPAADPLKINFQVEKAEIAPISVDESPTAPTSQLPEANSQDPAQAGAGGKPVILNHYPIDSKWVGGMNIIAIRSQIWVLTQTGDLVVYDTQNGQPVKSLALHPDRPSDPSSLLIYIFGNLAYDGKYLWTLIYSLPTPGDPRELFRIDPESGEILPVSLPVSDPTCDDYGCGWMALGVSPGKLWVSGENTVWVFDVNDPSQVTKIPETGSMGYMAFDGHEKMWGSIQSQHGFLMSIDVNDTSDMHAVDCIGCSWVMPVGDLIWAGADSMPSVLVAFEAAAFPGNSEPVLTVELQNEVNGVFGGNRVFFDGRYIWDKTALADTLFYYDPQDGHLVGSLSIYTPEGSEWNQLDTVPGMAFDGREVWVIGRTEFTPELVRIQLPWLE